MNENQNFKFSRQTKQNLDHVGHYLIIAIANRRGARMSFFLVVRQKLTSRS